MSKNPITSDKLNIKISIETWDDEKVMKWFRLNQLNMTILENLWPCNGQILGQIHEMKHTAPEFYYQAMAKSTNFDLRAISLFSFHLEKLFTEGLDIEAVTDETLNAANTPVLFGAKESRVLMLGLDGAGKTCLLYKMKLGEEVKTIPTIGFNVETVEHNNKKLTIWDVGGQSAIRPLWIHYFANTQAIMFVVDSCDKNSLEDVKKELHRVLEAEELKDSLLLVVANKQDLPDAMKCQEVSEILELVSLKHKWGILECSAKSGEGINEILEWIITHTTDLNK